MVTYCRVIDITKTSVSLISGKIVGVGCKVLNLHDALSILGNPDSSKAEQVLFYSWLPMVKEIRVCYKGAFDSKNRVEMVFDDESVPVVLYNTDLESKLFDFIHSV